MHEWVGSLLAPHYCSACGAIGAILCERCYYDIVSEPYEQCLVCGVVARSGMLCHACSKTYGRAWCVSERSGALRRVIDDFKFRHLHGAYRTLAGLLSDTLPILPSSIVVTNIPTISPHVRRRGYDHAGLIAREFARVRGLPYQPLLSRTTNDVQLGATKAARVRQACRAFRATRMVVPEIVLLIDDVYTTGSTVYYAAKTLRAAGVKEVWVAVIARQTLD